MSDHMPESAKDENARNAMQEIAEMVDDKLPTGYGFVVMAFPQGDVEGRLNYASNCNRDDVRNMIKEFLDETENKDSWGKHA